MSSVLSTSLECMFSIHTVRSNSGDENGCLSGKIPKLGIIKSAYFDGYRAMSELFPYLTDLARSVCRQRSCEQNMASKRGRQRHENETK
jgi:hypothetical protein